MQELSKIPELKIFLSYCHRDGATVEKLFKAIEARGWEIFWDQNVPAGMGFESPIKQELESAFAVIVVWSKDSLESPAVMGEAEWAFENHRLYHVVLDPTVKPPEKFGHLQATDLSYWDGRLEDPKIDKVLQFINNIADYHRGLKEPIKVNPPLQLIKH